MANPSITAITAITSLVTTTTIQPGQFIWVQGFSLAATTATWNGEFPITLGGTSVTIGGVSAFLAFVSPTVIALQVPTVSTGSVTLTVTTAAGSGSATVTIANFAPAFACIAPDALISPTAAYISGIILRTDGSGAYGGGSYDIVGPGESVVFGYPTVAIKAGDVVELFCGGLGATTPAVAPGAAFSSVAPTNNAVTLVINDVGIPVLFAGLTEAGLYQINFVLTPVVVNVSGATNATPIVITTSTPHNLSTGAMVTIAGVLGNLAANGTVGNVTVLSPTTFSLTAITGTGAYTSGGTVTPVLGDGDVLIVATVSGHATQAGVVISLA